MIRELAFDAARRAAGGAITSRHYEASEIVGMLDAFANAVDVPKALEPEQPASGLKAWLAAHGVSDASESAIIELFRNTEAEAVNDQQIAALATRLDCTPRQIRAVAKVEGNGKGWDNRGLLLCLWERHYLWKRVKVAVPFLSDPKPGGYTVDADGNGINDSWEKLARAAMRWGELAFECASFGKFQIMGAHWKALGYASAMDMVWALSRSEGAHYEALGKFVTANNLRGALQRIDGDPENAKAFALGYNGRAGVRNGYHQKNAAAWKVS